MRVILTVCVGINLFFLYLFLLQSKYNKEIEKVLLALSRVDNKLICVQSELLERLGSKPIESCRGEIE